MKFLIYLLFFSSFLFAEIGKISAIIGDANISRDGQKYKVTLGKILKEKDIIVTSDNSKLQIIFNDNTIVTLGKNSSLDISEYVYDTNNPKNSKTDLNFFRGAFKTITGNIGKINKEKFKLRTKAASIGIRGTIILGNQTNIACTSGEISVSSKGTTVIVPKNQYTKTIEGEAPSKSQILTNEILDNLKQELEPNSSNTSVKKDEAANKKESKSSNNEPSSLDEDSDNKKKSEKSKEKDQKVSFTSTENGLETQKEDSAKSKTISSEETIFVSNSPNIVSNANENSLNSNKTDIVSDVASNQKVKYDLNGYYFGGVYTSTYKLIQEEDAFTGKREDNTFSFYKGEKTFSSFDKRGTYTGFNTNSPVTIPFTNSIPAISGKYNIYTDNTGEVFIGFYENNSSSNKINYLFVLGNKTNPSYLEKDKIYIYKDFKEVIVEKSGSGTILDSKVGASDGYIYYNPTTGSLTRLSKDFYLNGAKGIVIGDSQGFKSYYNEYDYNIPLNLVGIKSSEGESDINFLGSQYQNIYYSTKEDTKLYSTQFKNILESSTQSLGTSLLIDNSSSVKDSGTYELEGYMVGNAYGNSYFMIDRLADLKLDIDRKNKTIKTDDNIEFVGSGSFKVDSRLSKGNAYYISDDIFGAMFDSSSSYVNGSKYSLVSNSGYLFSVPDGRIVGDEHKLYDDNDNPLMSDDESSWGYWTANFKNGDQYIFIDTQSTWIAGTKTADSIVENLINGSSKTLYFKGQVLGKVLLSNNSIEPIIVNDGINSVNLKFNLGGGSASMNGSTMKFKTSTTNWNLGMNSSTINKNGFSGSFTGGSGSYNGNYYGTDSVKSVGGSFTVSSGSNLASGVFKASKWKEE